MHNVAFLVGSPNIAGGTNVIFRHAMGLAEQDVSVTIVAPKRIGRQEVAWHPIVSVYDHPNLLWQDFSDIIDRRFDLAIATWWKTYLDLWKLSAVQYAYFVQSIESRFYSPTESITRCAVDATYDLACGFITEAKWIRDYLQRVHGHEAELAPNGIDKNIFTFAGPALSPRQSGKLRLLIEGPIDVPFKNVPASVRLARAAGVDEIWLLTSSDISQFPGVDRVFSRIPHDQTPEVYRSCDVILKLSLVEGMFGPPLEMFHCGGTCVVYNVSGHDEYITHGKNGLVVPMHDESKVVEALRHLLQAPGLVATLKQNALATAQAWPDWSASTSQFADGLRRIAEQKPLPRDNLRRYAQRISYLHRISNFMECGYRQSTPASAPLTQAPSISPSLCPTAPIILGAGFESRRPLFFLFQNQRSFLPRIARTIMLPFSLLARGVRNIFSLLKFFVRAVLVFIAAVVFRPIILKAIWQMATDSSFHYPFFEKIKRQF